MRVAVTGTPGTGKSTVTNLLETDLDVVHLNEVVLEEELTEGEDPDRDTMIADLEAIRDWLDGRDDVLVESHLAHLFDADRVIVLRAHPDELTRRLRQRDENESSIRENAESEALDVILAEAVDRHGRDAVYEIDTTDLDPSAVAAAIDAAIAGERDPSAGTVSYVDWL